jgi:hypothetical protein
MRTWVALLIVAAVGCGDDGTSMDAAGDTSAEPEPAELACMEVEEAGTPIAAGEMRDSSAPEVTIGAEPYLVSLPVAGTGYLRVVTDAPEEPAILFFQTSGVLTDIYDDEDTALGVTSAGENPFCAAAIPEHFDLDFEVAGTHYIELTAASETWLLISGAEGHAHME